MDPTNPTLRQRVETRVEPPPLGLTRTADHVYTFNTGTEVFSPLPSVTTILKVLDKSGPLVGWAKRETGGDAAAVAWLKTIPDFQRGTAADIGTRVHQLAEQLARGAEPEVTEVEAPYVRAYRSFLATYQPRFLAVEEMVASLKHRYAGTLDAVAIIDGETWLLDVKTGAGVYGETGLQLAGYNFAD
ncbi:MAG: hypothetical protein P4L84_08280, partial [Isosphaeraceae bacterium]|nr:hypothetical protein [Isosphaeraceae bacterium]